MENLKNVNMFPVSLGHLPASYALSLSYEEQLICIGKKTDEIIDFINTILEQKISEYINAKFNDMIIDTMYEAETETLILYLNSTN